MRTALKTFLIFGCVALSICIGFVAWNIFSVVHFFVLDAVGDYRELRGDGVRPAYWKDFIPHMWPYALPLLFASVSFVFAVISGMLVKSIFYRGRNLPACSEKHDRFSSAIYLFVALFSTVIFSGCEDRNKSLESIEDPPEFETHQKNGNTANPDDPLTEETGTPEGDLNIYEQMSPSLINSFMQLRGDGPKIPIMMKAWSELWQGRFNDPAAEDAISSIRSQAPDSIMTLLRNGGTLEGFERINLAAIGGLYIGWANDQNLSGQLYYLLRKRSDILPQSEGDAFISVFISEMIDVIEPPNHFEEEDVIGWERVAKGKNSVYRQAALRIHERLSSNIDIRESFLKLYSHEAENAIKEEALTQIDGFPKEPRRKLLEAFREGQLAIGDSEFSIKIQSAIDK